MQPSFRLGSTSYVYAGDLIHNVERLAGAVDDIELILFVLPTGESNLPTPTTIQKLADLAADHNLTYTVHLPQDLCAVPHEEHPSLQMAEQVIRLVAPLKPHAYIFHLDGTGIDKPGWLAQAQHAVASLLPLVDSPAQLALENLESYAPEHLSPIFAATPIRRALDIGHLWKARRDPFALLDDWLPTTSVVHLHGMAESDHISLACMSPSQLDPIITRLLDWHGVLTLEVFEEDFFTSRDALLQALQRIIG